MENVTPTAYTKMFRDMGVSCVISKKSVLSAQDYVREMQRYGFKILEPFTENGPGKRNETPAGGKIIEIEAGAGVRVIKLTAKKDGVVLGYVYLGSSGYNSEREYSAFDLNLYKQVRERVEAKIWTDQMSNLEKIEAMAEYINETTHYPNMEITSKEYNPTLWNDWSVDGKQLFYSMFNDVILNRIMAMA
jgi:hypothetical protein